MSRNRRFAVLALFFLTGASLSASGQSQSSTATAPSAAGESGKKPAASAADAKLDYDVYQIGVEDELMISVWHEPELSSSVVVRPDGKITLPLINDIQVTGLKTSQLQSLLTERLKPFVNEPQVTVIVKSIKSRKVYLMGQVNRQGPYPLNGRKTVLGLIAEAGGLGPFAKGNSIYVLRRSGEKQTRIPFHYKKALSGKDADVELYPGDTVVVP